MCRSIFAGGSMISLAILEQHLKTNAFAIGARPTIADISMMAYLHYPADETGYDFAASHPAIRCLARPHVAATRMEIGL